MAENGADGAVSVVETAAGERAAAPVEITPVWEVVEDIARRLSPMVAAEPDGPIAKAAWHIMEAVKILKGD